MDTETILKLYELRRQLHISVLYIFTYSVSGKKSEIHSRYVLIWVYVAL